MNSAQYLSKVGRPQDALETNQEGPRLMSINSTPTHPDGNRSDLAGSLMNSAQYLSEVGRPTRCARNEQRGRSTYVDNSARLIPDGNQSDLAGSLMNRRSICRKSGDLQDALEDE